MRLIDADALIKSYEGYVGYSETIQDIENAPTVAGYQILLDGLFDGLKQTNASEIKYSYELWKNNKKYKFSYTLERIELIEEEG